MDFFLSNPKEKFGLLLIGCGLFLFGFPLLLATALFSSTGDKNEYLKTSAL